MALTVLQMAGSVDEHMRKAIGRRRILRWLWEWEAEFFEIANLQTLIRTVETARKELGCAEFLILGNLMVLLPTGRQQTPR